MGFGEVEVITLSQIDTERFGSRIARAQVSKGNLGRVLECCAVEQVEMLIARCPTNDLSTAQEMEAAGFLLMDTLVYYSFDLAKRTIPDDSPRALVRKFRQEDTAEIQRVAGAAFQGYYGHYHADRRLDRAKCDEGYVSWAVRSCTSKQVVNEVLVAALGQNITGFITLRLNTPTEADGLLFGVAPEAQGKGLGRSLLLGALRWCKEQSVKRMIISTQVTNVIVQKVWCGVGFEPSHSYYTFHKWFS